MKTKPAPQKLDAAWESFFASQRFADPKALYAEGWRTAAEIGEALKLNNSAARSLCIRKASDGEFEIKKLRVQLSAGVREVNFYRLKAR
jgi:hypothetical protein